MIAVIWTANMFLMSPIAILSQLLPIHTSGKFKCREVWPSDTSEELFNLSLLLLLLIIPFVLMALNYTLISKELYGTLNILQLRHQKDQYLADRPNHTNNNNNINSHFMTFMDFTDSPSTSMSSPDNNNVTYNCNCNHGICTSNHSSMSNRTNVLIISAGINGSESTTSTVVKKVKIGNSRGVLTQMVNKKRIIRMLCVLVLEFFICWTPVYVINIWSLYWPKQMYSMVSPTIISYIHLLSYLSSCTNPITYCFMHKKFREAMMMWCRNGGSPNRYVITDLDQSSSTNQSLSAHTNSTGVPNTTR
ncbi:unnamed protein product, partial [Oppiella nova]